jgi:subtilisin-like proprotein convertase family protein
MSTISVSGAGSQLGEVRLQTSIRHSSSVDLDITLTSPAGTIVTITSDNGGTNDNVFNGTQWFDRANPGGQVPYATTGS